MYTICIPYVYQIYTYVWNASVKIYVNTFLYIFTILEWQVDEDCIIQLKTKKHIHLHTSFSWLDWSKLMWKKARANSRNIELT